MKEIKIPKGTKKITHESNGPIIFNRKALQFVNIIPSERVLSATIKMWREAWPSMEKEPEGYQEKYLYCQSYGILPNQE